MPIELHSTGLPQTFKSLKKNNICDAQEIEVQFKKDLLCFQLLKIYLIV